MKKLQVTSALIATAMGLAIVSSAQAAVIVSAVPGPGSLTNYPGQSLIANFDGFLAPGYTLSGSYEILTGSVFNGPGCPAQCAATPLGDSTSYLNVRPGYTPATLTTPAPLESFSLYWGSIDIYNTISFYGGANLIQSFTGADIDNLTTASANGSQVDASGNQRINFEFLGTRPDKIILGSSQIAFESDNFAAAVPEPGTWVMLIVGFGLIGCAMRRRPAAKDQLALA